MVTLVTQICENNEGHWLLSEILQILSAMPNFERNYVHETSSKDGGHMQNSE